MNIRAMISQDLPACAQIMAENSLWQRYGVTAESAMKRLSSGLENDATILVAQDQNVVGFLWYVQKGAFQRSGYVMLIGVAPEAQSLGVGAQLMDEAERIMFTTSRDVILLVSDFNLSAQRFYKRRGYYQIGAIPDYVLPGITELIFRKVKPS
jgi:ribosomal protein S18 acetylase RimI-like enzyme